MKVHTRIILVASLTAAVVGAQAMPTGAFLRKPAYKAADLITAMRTDPIVADRYVRHFRMTRTDLCNYFGTLHLAKIDEGGAYTVYNVHDSIIRSRVLNLKKGTLVFADINGRPILQQICGNPLVWEIPPIAATAPIGTPEGPRTQPVGEGEAIVGEAPMAMPGVGPVPDVEKPHEVVTVTRRSGGAAGLLIIPLILGIGGGSSCCCRPPKHDCPPVPEPATMTAMVAGGVAFLAKRRKKK